MNKFKKIMAFALAMILGLMPAPLTKADSVEVKPYISFGADLSKEQKATVLSLLGVEEDALDEYETIEITNKDEHDYLDDYLSSSVIGTKALSSVRIEKVDEGKGIHVETKNISYCTSGMYTNALITAGITDADVIVAGPFNISGTAALVGAMKAYATMTGKEISPEQADAATNELVATGEIAQSIGADKAEQLVALAKQKVADGDLTSEAQIRDAIDDSAKELDINLTDAQKEQLVKLFDKIKGLDLDVNKLKQQAETVYNKLRDFGVDIDKASGFFDKMVQFFENAAEKLSSIFSDIF